MGETLGEKVKRMVITHARCCELLAADEAVHHNRRVKQAKVQKYARMMKDGCWLISPDAITIADDGFIANGQHRLLGQRIAGVDVEYLVMLNVPRAYALQMQAVTDDGINRTVAESISLRGLTGAKPLHVQTVTRVYLGLEAAAGPAVDKQILFDLLEKHWKAIDFAISIALQGRKIPGVTSAPVLAPIARAFYSADKERLKQFGSVLVTGEVEDPKKDQAAVFLLRSLTRGKLAAQGAVGAIDCYAKTEFALNAFIECERIKRLKPVAEELYQVPGEEAWKKRAKDFLAFYENRQIELLANAS